MNKVSQRHHYLPQFYLKGFTNERGKFKIYDVEKQYFIQSGKEFSTKSYFYEKDGNSVIKDGIKFDTIETEFYKKQDDKISKIFNKIRNNIDEKNFGITDVDIPLLQLFISSLFWRVPTNFDQIRHIISVTELQKLGLVIKSKNDDSVIKDSELECKIKNDPFFFKSIKYIIPYLTYQRLFDCTTPITILRFPKQYPVVCSDNPVIIQNSFCPDIYFDDFIFPLTNNLVLIRSEKINSILDLIKIDIDLILLKQAKKYVSCTDEHYIELLNKYYDENYSSVSELKTSVFNQLLY